MAQRMVMVTNMVNAMVSVKDQAFNVNRRWMKRGQTIPIPYEAVENMLWEEGFRRMIESGVLYIQNMKDKQDLGLEPMEATKPTNIKALTEQDMKNLWNTVPITVFKKEVVSLPRVQVDSLVEYAIQNKIVDGAKCSFIKDLTHKDILSAISAIEEDAKADDLDRRRQEAYAAEGRRG